MRKVLFAGLLALSTGQTGQAPTHTAHPAAQWFPDAALGLFLHWDPASVKGQNIGWFGDSRESHYNLDGKPWPITPAEYWSWARDFRPAQTVPTRRTCCRRLTRRSRSPASGGLRPSRCCATDPRCPSRSRNGTVTVTLPASKRTKLVDVVRIDLTR